MVKFIGTYAIIIGLSLISFQNTAQVDAVKPNPKDVKPVEYVKVVTVVLKINNIDYKFIVRPDQEVSIICRGTVRKNQLKIDSVANNPLFKEAVLFPELKNSKFYIVDSDFMTDEDGIIGKDVYEALKEELEKQIKK